VENEIVSVHEASQLLKITKSRVYQLIQEKKIKLYKGMPLKVSVLDYEKNRKQVGRPRGIKLNGKEEK
jgi:predicted HTH domain antitoxin